VKHIEELRDVIRRLHDADATHIVAERIKVAAMIKRVSVTVAMLALGTINGAVLVKVHSILLCALSGALCSAGIALLRITYDRPFTGK
jgi:hypothetical protein